MHAVPVSLHMWSERREAQPRASRLALTSSCARRRCVVQRYVKHLPSAGEIVLFDRSWYNRAGVERVMSFCTDEEYEEFIRATPLFEEMLINSGIILLKYWFSVSSQEQERRFKKCVLRHAPCVCRYR